MKGKRMKKHCSISGRVSGRAWILALPLGLVAVVAVALTIQADSGPFDGSSVVPTADEVGVGQRVGFALYVVNSSPVTVTDVLVWNRLPPGSTYVSASGGAFPLMGSVTPDLVLAVPPEGCAYDSRLKSSAPLTDPDDVTGIAWVGDVPPGEMVVLGLIVTVDDPAGRFMVDEMFIYDDRDQVGHFSGQAWVPPHRLFLPYIFSRLEPPIPAPATITFTIPYGQGLGFGGGSLDPDYWQALAGSDLEGRFGDGSVYLGQVPPSGPYLPWYVIGRAYMGWDTSMLPDGAAVLTATLVLNVACHPPETPFGTTVYRGEWAPPLNTDAWYAMGDEPAGVWDTADYPCTGNVGTGQVRIELDPSVVNRTGLTLLEMRSDREGTPPTGLETVQLKRSAEFPGLVITWREGQ